MIAGLCRPGLFRLFLAFLVVISHLSRFDVGRIAVLLFFFLSGFWIANIWDTKFKGEPIRFYLARTLRIYPLYWLVASFAVFAFPTPLSLSNFIIFRVANAASDPVGVSWSLDIEMQFYLLLPLLILLPTKVLLPGSLALSAICWRFLPVPTLALYLPAFALGVACYIGRWQPSAPVAAGSVAAFLAASVAAFVFAPGFVNKNLPDPFHVDIFSFFWMLPLIPFVAWSLRLKSTPFDRHLGNISYPLYLVHPSVASLLAGSPRPLVFAVAIAVAVLMYVAFDRPVDAFRVHLLEKRHPLTAESDLPAAEPVRLKLPDQLQAPP